MNLFDSAVTFTPPSQLWIQISWIIQSLMQKQEELIWWHCPFKKWVIHSFCLVNLQLKFFLEKLWLQYCYIWMYFSFSRIFNNNKFEFLLLLGSWFDERNRTKKWCFLMYFESTGDYKFSKENSLHTVCKNSSIIFSAETTCASNGEWTCKCFGPKFLFLFRSRLNGNNWSWFFWLLRYYIETNRELCSFCIWLCWKSFGSTFSSFTLKWALHETWIIGAPRGIKQYKRRPLSSLQIQ